MSLWLYDTALVDKIKKWTDKTDLHVYNTTETNRLFQINADMGNDNPIELPILCVTRGSQFTISNTSQKPTSYDGFRLNADSSTGEVSQLNMIPIKIPYFIDIYTRYREEVDTYIRDIIFNIINHPSMKVTIPYNDIQVYNKSTQQFQAITHTATLYITDTVEDNSSIPEILIDGQFYRSTLSVYIDDAYLWSVPARKLIEINSPGSLQVNTNMTEWWAPISQSDLTNTWNKNTIYDKYDEVIYNSVKYKSVKANNLSHLPKDVVIEQLNLD